jgi:type III pantothenate kinase
MNLAIDIGNFSAKLGCFYNGQLKKPVDSINPSEIAQVINTLNPENIIISTVVEMPRIHSISGQVIKLSATTPLPFTLDYQTKNSLGVDRIAAAAGAMVLNPSSDSLVIDAGSCITYDILEGGSRFLGGVISPGGRLRFQAMHQFTKNLPLIDIGTASLDALEFPGKSTVSAMKSGVIDGLEIEIQGFIKKYMKNYPAIKVFLCGGEAKLFENRLKASIFVVPELVMIGLNRILEYNLSDESNR